MLSRDNYRLMEVNLNNKQFLQPLDADNINVTARTKCFKGNFVDCTGIRSPRLMPSSLIWADLL